MRVVGGIMELETLVGEELGTSDWHEITQERVNAFAAVTGDPRWTYLPLSLLPALMSEVWRVEGERLGINYGLNRVRFPSPVPVGSRVRVVARLKEVSPLESGVQGVVEATVEVAGGAKPAAVAESVFRLVV